MLERVLIEMRKVGGAYCLGNFMVSERALHVLDLLEAFGICHTCECTRLSSIAVK